MKPSEKDYPVADTVERQVRLESVEPIAQEIIDKQSTTPRKERPRPPEADEFHAPDSGPERAEKPEEAGVGG